MVFYSSSQFKEDINMKIYYYKVVKDNKIIGQGTSLKLRKFQIRHQTYTLAVENTAQYFELNGIYYHDYWMKTDPVHTTYDQASVIPISKEEYYKLKNSQG